VATNCNGSTCTGLGEGGRVVVDRVGGGTLGAEVVATGTEGVEDVEGAEDVEYVGSDVATGRATVGRSSPPCVNLRAMNTPAATRKAVNAKISPILAPDLRGGGGGPPGIGPHPYCGPPGGGP